MTTTDWLGDQRHELAVERILESAGRIFASDGIQGARMGKIAEAAGCARATLYRYFPRKELLLHAYMDHIAQQFYEIIRGKLQGVRSLGGRLVEGAAMSVELIQVREDVAPFFSEEGLGLTAQLTANAADLRARLAQEIERDSSSTHIEGQLRRGVGPDEAAEWVMRAILSFAVLPAPRSGPELREFLKQMLLPSLVDP